MGKTIQEVCRQIAITIGKQKKEYPANLPKGSNKLFDFFSLFSQTQTVSLCSDGKYKIPHSLKSGKYFINSSISSK